MRTLAIGALAALVGSSASALAAPTLYATSGSYMYRVDLNSLGSNGEFGVDSFNLGTPLVSLTVGNEGELWATERYDSNENGFHALYRLDDINSIPVLTEQGDFLHGYNSAMVNLNGRLHAFKDSTRELIEIDAVNDNYTVVGSYGDVPFSPASAGFDVETQSMYGIKTNELYRFDINLELPTAVATQKIADVDFGQLAGPVGGEIIDGVYYHAVVVDLTMHIFTIDMQTGATTELISFGVHDTGAVGLTGMTVPAPGALALLGLGGAMTTRRRRH